MCTGRLAAAAFLAALFAGCDRTADAPPAMPTPEFSAPAVGAWRTKHEADYRREYVSIAGLHSLKAGPNTAGSAATNAIVLPASTPLRLGTFVLHDNKVQFQPAPKSGVLLNDKPVSTPIDLADDGEPDADELTVGEVRIVIHVSGNERMLRVRDPNGPLAKGFLGFAWFPIDAAHRVAGRFIQDAEPKAMKVANTFGDVDEYKSEGVVEFRFGGETLRLRPFTTRPKRLYFVFRDASSGKETYEAARFLYADLLDDGTTWLDFNMAYNPPCSFNPYTTCPIPLPENRLPVKILAGEKAYPVHVTLPTREDASKASTRSR